MFFSFAFLLKWRERNIFQVDSCHTLFKACTIFKPQKQRSEIKSFKDTNGCSDLFFKYKIHFYFLYSFLLFCVVFDRNEMKKVEEICSQRKPLIRITCLLRPRWLFSFLKKPLGNARFEQTKRLHQCERRSKHLPFVSKVSMFTKRRSASTAPPLHCSCCTPSSGAQRARQCSAVKGKHIKSELVLV